MFLFLISILGLISAGALYTIEKTRIYSFGLAGLSAIFFFTSILFTVDEGEAVVLIQFGKIYDSIDTPGIHTKRPWANTSSYPKRINQSTMQIEVRTMDGMKVTIDTTTWFKVDTGKIDMIYRQTATNVETLKENIIIPALRTTIRNSISKYTVKELYSTREEVQKEILADASDELAKKHVILDNVLLRDIRLPEDVEHSVQGKIRAQQDAEAAEFRKQKAIKEAEIKVEEARGIAKAQAIINQTLTPYYLQHEAIQTYRELASSPNTTFIVMPTSPNASGMPLIIGAPK
ncbi:MAG: prohibitin family protein [Spirochaetia bacterium]|nr:prohibitin family protein [Spirochaetia bacterium]